MHARTRPPLRLPTSHAAASKTVQGKPMDAFWMWASARWAAFSTWCAQPATNGLIFTVAAHTAAAQMVVLLIMQRS